MELAKSYPSESHKLRSTSAEKKEDKGCTSLPLVQLMGKILYPQDTSLLPLHSTDHCLRTSKNTSWKIGLQRIDWMKESLLFMDSFMQSLMDWFICSLANDTNVCCSRGNGAKIIHHFSWNNKYPPTQNPLQSKGQEKFLKWKIIHDRFSGLFSPRDESKLGQVYDALMMDGCEFRAATGTSNLDE